jgi:hypothetical protein
VNLIGLLEPLEGRWVASVRDDCGEVCSAAGRTPDHAMRRVLVRAMDELGLESLELEFAVLGE